VPIVGNVPDVLDEMIKLLDGGSKTDPEVVDWWKQIDEWRGRKVVGLRQTEHHAAVRDREALRSHRGDAFITSDVGQHQMFAAQYYKFDKPRRWINSGGLGTMGVGCLMPWAC
jgi:acetolactate synthase I/II/III large subunit